MDPAKNGVQDLTGFKNVNLSRNNLSIISTISGDENLEQLNLENSNIYFIMKDSFEMLIGLKTLNLRNNKIRKMVFDLKKINSVNAVIFV